MAETTSVRIELTLTPTQTVQHAETLALLGTPPSGKRPAVVSYEVELTCPRVTVGRLLAWTTLLTDPAVAGTLVIGDGPVGAFLTALRGAHG